MWYPPLKKAKGAVSGRGYYEVRYGTAANALYGVNDLSCVCRGCETATLAPKVPCDCLKVGLDFVSTDFQAVSRHFRRLERMA